MKVSRGFSFFFLFDVIVIFVFVSRRWIFNGLLVVKSKLGLDGILLKLIM